MNNNEMPDINIVKKSESERKFVFEIEIKDKLSKSKHIVFLDKNDYERLKGAGDAPEILVKKSFEFLLQREPKDAILREFDLTQISDYFPEFEEKISG